MLRREGLRSSHLSAWRKQRAERGQTVEERTIAQLERKLAALETENRIRRKLLELSAEAHEILGLALPRIEDSDETAGSSSSGSAKKR